MDTKRYWLRGGITFVIVGLIGYIVLFSISNYIYTSNQDVANLLYKAIVLEKFIAFPYIVFAPFVNSFRYAGDFVFILMIVTINVAVYFCIGAIIGWLYGKIKNRNQIN